MTGHAAPSAIIIHSLDQAFAAATVAEAAAVPVFLRSAPGAAGYAGVGWFAALAAMLAERHPSLQATLILDCADEAGTAMGALRRGIRHIRFSGSPDIAAKLVSIGAILDTDTRPALDLLGEADPEAACRRWLSGADG
jgi:fructose/tagatose bisphosphate aldolase